ncbi:unnamed protein product [Mytilus edulis]|uniref:Toll-like receptor 3 n=1 Tax=Mytilus edulis TaxID=6550 RepID=A0A8S3U5W0_MYTED|nr:unnamed protein product [Mytilus edulis]
MAMSKVLLALCKCILLVGLTKAIYSKMNEQTVNVIDYSMKNLTSMPIFQQNSTTDINLRGNLLQVVPALSFQQSKKLKSLDLSMNKLNLIERGAFEGLTELIYLSLRDNKLTSNSFHVGIFQDLISLQDLNIHLNFFSYEYTLILQSEISHLESLVRLGIDLRGQLQINKCFCKLSQLLDLELVGLRNYSDNLFQNSKLEVS